MSNSNLFLSVKLKTVLVTANSNCSCLRRTQPFSCCVELKVFYSTLQRVYSSVLLNSAAGLIELFCSTLQRVYSNCSWNFKLNSVSESAQSCSKSAQLCQRVLLFCILNGVKSLSHQWVHSLCKLHEEFGYFVLCTLFKIVTVSCIKSLHYSVDSGLCTTLKYCCVY